MEGEGGAATDGDRGAAPAQTPEKTKWTDFLSPSLVLVLFLRPCRAHGRASERVPDAPSARRAPPLRLSAPSAAPS